MRKVAMVAAVGFALLPARVWVQSASDKQMNGSIDQIEQSIRSQLNLGPDDPIDPARVPDRLMTQLGDAVMDQLVPDRQQHEWMDQMGDSSWGDRGCGGGPRGLDAGDRQSRPSRAGGRGEGKARAGDQPLVARHDAPRRIGPPRVDRDRPRRSRRYAHESPNRGLGRPGEGHGAHAQRPPFGGAATISLYKALTAAGAGKEEAMGLISDGARDVYSAMGRMP